MSADAAMSVDERALEESLESLEEELAKMEQNGEWEAC